MTVTDTPTPAARSTEPTLVADRYRLETGLFLRPTPAGAYYAVCGPEPDPARQLLLALMAEPVAPALTVGAVRAWTGEDDEVAAVEVLAQAQDRGWIEGWSEASFAETESLEVVLPRLLPALSSTGMALLADDQGFAVSAHGFDDQAAEELSALSADLAILHARHRSLLHRNTSLETSAWALVDAVGNSQVGFWPLFIGDHRFVLVIGGVPRTNHPQLTDLIWTLAIRYGDD